MPRVTDVVRPGPVAWPMGGRVPNVPLGEALERFRGWTPYPTPLPKRVIQWVDGPYPYPTLLPYMGQKWVDHTQTPHQSFQGACPVECYSGPGLLGFNSWPSCAALIADLNPHDHLCAPVRRFPNNQSQGRHTT
jgi:hypothetical protein